MSAAVQELLAGLIVFAAAAYLLDRLVGVTARLGLHKKKPAGPAVKVGPGLARGLAKARRRR